MTKEQLSLAKIWEPCSNHASDHEKRQGTWWGGVQAVVLLLPRNHHLAPALPGTALRKLESQGFAARSLPESHPKPHWSALSHCKKCLWKLKLLGFLPWFWKCQRAGEFCRGPTHDGGWAKTFPWRPCKAALGLQARLASIWATVQPSHFQRRQRCALCSLDSSLSKCSVLMRRLSYSSHSFFVFFTGFCCSQKNSLMLLWGTEWAQSPRAVSLGHFHQHCLAICPACFVFALHFINTTSGPCCPSLWVY